MKSINKTFGVYLLIILFILFKNGKEVKRFQADISFKMVATRKEVQSSISELIMDKF